MRFRIFFVFILFALFSCANDGDTIDGFRTESVSVYRGEDSVYDSSIPNEYELELYNIVKVYFSEYYNGVFYTTSFDPSEREITGGDECYVFRSYTEDGDESFKISVDVNGTSMYGYEPETERQALISYMWCEEWTAPDFSYFGEKEISGL